MTKQAKQKSTKAYTQPAWYTAVTAELERLTGHWKQEPTILGIISKEIAGEAWDTDDFWKEPGHPNRSTYYKWMKQDETFLDVLEKCKQAVRTYRREESINHIDEAMLIIQEASPQAARKLVQHIDAPDDGDSIRASNSILDRASKDTANKQPDATIKVPGIIEAMDIIYGDAEDESGEPGRHHEGKE